jgi:hypothetical protein
MCYEATADYSKYTEYKLEARHKRYVDFYTAKQGQW